MIITLDKANFEQVTEAWNEGFSDYVIPIKMDKAALKKRVTSLKLSTKLSAVFIVDGEYAGVILLGMQNFTHGKVMWVGGMAVVPQFRRSKVATQLMAYAEAVAKENHCDFLTLEVIASNERAKKLYETEGFRVVNELAVGNVQFAPLAAKNDASIKFASLSSQQFNEVELQWTPWQNQLIFAEIACMILDGQSKIGFVSFDLSTKANQKILAIKQLHLFEQANLAKMTDILAALKDQEKAAELRLYNFDMCSPEYQAIAKLGVTLQLTQFQMAKEIIRGGKI